MTLYVYEHTKTDRKENTHLTRKLSEHKWLLLLI